MTWTDRLLARVGLVRAPKSAPQRRAHYTAASGGRLFADWTPWGASPRDEWKSDAAALRRRARELAKNSPLVRRYLQLIEEQVVGPYGPQLEAKHVNNRKRLMTAENTAIEAAWLAWADTPSAVDFEGRRTLAELLYAIHTTRRVDGEVFVVRHLGDRRSPVGLTLQLLESELCDPRFDDASRNIRQGIEFDGRGRPIAYHFWTVHPDEHVGMTPRERVRVPADRVWHLFKPHRPGATRGISELAAAMELLHDQRGYAKATLVAARVSAAKMGAITTDPTKAGGYVAEDAGAVEQVEADPGRFWRLQPGESLELFDPQYPPVTYDSYDRTLKADIAAGLGVSYATLTGDLSQANYSSARVGLLTERDHWRREQEWTERHILRPLYREWLPMALLSGHLVLPTLEASRWQTVTFRARGYQWVDPEKEIRAAADAVALGVKSRTEIVAETGGDIEDVLGDLEREQVMMQEAGVPVTVATTGTAPAAPPNA